MHVRFQGADIFWGRPHAVSQALAKAKPPAPRLKLHLRNYIDNPPDSDRPKRSRNIGICLSGPECMTFLRRYGVEVVQGTPLREGLAQIKQQLKRQRITPSDMMLHAFQFVAQMAEEGHQAVTVTRVKSESS